ncbi:MFS general substrate transporter [Vararia minispora EC-137]|uniref:MFS general substrate transporter n=1 Tax=Vararia minispora EC-137 TaxID=1314806 RepID=A0ACB8Q579_9AGAM|nr:MFS general substrate transporter [Vararia minispora EC-137]
MVAVDSEIAPLLAHEQDIYDRFSARTKSLVVAQVAFCALLPMFVGGSFVPSIPQIARDLGTTGAVVNVAVSLSIFGSSTGSLTWARYSGFYGRRPIYLTSLPILAVGSFGVAAARSVPALMFWRAVQAFGAGGGFAVGAGVIADMYRLEERGRAMGIFFAAALLGPAVAPPIGGFVARYFSWRMMQLSIGVAAIFALGFMTAWMPETSQPGVRGVDKLKPGARRAVLLNPFKDLVLLRSPNILAACIVGTGVLATDLLMLNPLAYTLGERYNIHSEAIIGLLFCPCGLGNMIGAPISGRLSDRAIITWRAKRAGAWVPEDRLRATLLGTGLLVPLSVLSLALSTTFVSNRGLGLALAVIALFANGIGVDFALTPLSAYAVDILHDRSAEVTAATTCLRGTLIALLVSGILPALDRFGMLATHAAIAALAWACFGLLLLTIRFGREMRAWVDVGYTTSVAS